MPGVLKFTDDGGISWLKLINSLRKAVWQCVFKAKELKKLSYFLTLQFTVGIHHREVIRLSYRGICIRKFHCLVIYNIITTRKKCLILRDRLNNLWHMQLIIKLSSLLKLYSWRLFKDMSKCLKKVVK